MLAPRLSSLPVPPPPPLLLPPLLLLRRLLLQSPCIPAATARPRL
jgi:hypothetical protein